MKAHQCDTDKNLGSRIRPERKKHKLSPEGLSKRLGISRMTLQRIETGATSPSIILLTEIVFHLKRPVDSFIREGEAKVVHLREDQQDTIFNGQRNYRLIGPKGLILDRVTLTYSELGKDMVIEKHTNNGFEWAFLIEASALVEVSGTVYLFRAGDAIFYDAHFPHSIRVRQKVKYVGLFLRDE